MLTAYVDLAVPKLGSLEPFVGAAHNRIGETRMTFEDDDDRAGREPDRCRLDADGGVCCAVERTYNARSRVALHGTWRDSQRAGRVVWRDGSQEPGALDLAETRAKLRGHGPGLSLRYAF